MLPGVLLHVVETTGPVDLAGNDCLLAQMGCHDMDHLAVVIYDIQDVDAAKAADVAGLTARRRVESRPVEHDCRSAIELEGTPDDGVECGTGGVGVVDAISCVMGSGVI